MTKVVFEANDGSHGYELWVSDGTAAGTYMVQDIYPGPGGSYLSDVVGLGNGKALFGAKTGGPGQSVAYGDDLWVTNGTPGGLQTTRYYFTGGTSVVVRTNNSAGLNPRYITALGNGKALFSAGAGSAGSYELWVSDGTTAGTSLVKDINPGSASSDPHDITARTPRPQSAKWTW
jgi:ELWxxDGT repeat protein